MAVEWGKVRDEYVRDESTSYRSLAKKYGVGLATVGKRARAEKWPALRERKKDKMLTKTIETAAEAEARRAIALHTAADKVLDGICKAIDENPEMLTVPSAIKQITGALRDLREINDVRGSRDIREQEARIANLEKTAKEAENAENKQIVVRIESKDPAAEDWSK